MKITNNTILVTGGGSGIGLSLARAFSRHGNTVIVCGRNPAKLEAVHKQDPDIITFVSDITNDHEQHNLINALVQKYPQLNMLVNNAGIQYNYDFTDGNDHRALIDEEVNINFVAHMKLMDQLLPSFMKMQVAAIVNVSSALGVVPKQSAPIYCATKAAIHNFSKALRYQLEKTPIKVFEIIPTLVDTEMTKGRGKNKVSPDFLAAEVLRSIETDKYEIPIGKTRILFLLNRFVPTIAQRIARNVYPSNAALPADRKKPRPLKNSVRRVKFAITMCILTAVLNLYAVTQGYVGLSQVARGIITDVVFAVALLTFYPWRAKQGSA